MLLPEVGLGHHLPGAVAAAVHTARQQLKFSLICCTLNLTAAAVVASLPPVGELQCGQHS
jgi:hypothetical protein